MWPVARYIPVNVSHCYSTKIGAKIFTIEHGFDIISVDFSNRDQRILIYSLDRMKVPCHSDSKFRNSL